MGSQAAGESERIMGMIDIDKLSEKDVGRWVEYIPNRGLGRIKSWNDKFIFVVYECAGDWDNYQNYTAVVTGAEDLGWIDYLNERNKIMDTGFGYFTRVSLSMADLLEGKSAGGKVFALGDVVQVKDSHFKIETIGIGRDTMKLRLMPDDEIQQTQQREKT